MMRAITACIKLSERAVASAALDRDEGGTRRLDTAELKADSDAFDDARMSTISSLMRDPCGFNASYVSTIRLGVLMPYGWH